MSRNGRPATPKGDKEELIYFKGIYQLRGAIELRAIKMSELNQIDRQIGLIVDRIKGFTSYAELGKMLGMTESQAKTYLAPLIPERIEEG